MENKLEAEQKLLQVSVYGALFFALLAIIWGVFFNSKIILFDGVYSLISVGLSSISLVTASFIQKRDFNRFPYGKEMIEPVIILGKFLVITILCLFSLFSGISTLLSGGQSVNAGAGIIYAFLATLGCFLFYKFLDLKNRNIQSGLTLAESQQWLMDFFLSLAVLVGFVISFLLGFTRYKHLMPFADPLMVIMVSAYFLKVPFSNIWKQIKELIDMKADEKYMTLCKQIVEKVETKYDFHESFLRVSKSGSKLFIEIDFVVLPTGWHPSLQDQDDIRQEILDYLQPITLKKWLNVGFTLDRKWAV